MDIKKICEVLENKDFLEVSDYIPYHYEIEMVKPDVWKHWERDMWIAQWEKQGVLQVKDTYYGTIEIYSLHPITIPTKKKIFDTTYKFKAKETRASKVGGVEKGIQEILKKECKVDSTLRECFTHEWPTIEFTYKGGSLPNTIYEYIIFKLNQICKEHNIQYYYNYKWDQLTLLSFEPIPYKAVEQIKKELGEYIKNENC